MQRYTVTLEAESSFSEFVEAFNVGFCREIGGEWSGNLDAFNDYLSWPEEESFELVLIGWSGCRKMLSSKRAAGSRLIDVFNEIFSANSQVNLQVT